MGHVVHIRSKEQFIQVIGVLNEMPGTWHLTGTPEDRVLLLTDAHYKALVKARVIPANDKEVKRRGKKAAAKNAKP